MADTASLDTDAARNTRADLFPAVMGWCDIHSNSTTSLTLSGLLLSHTPKNFPLQARIRIYDKGQLVHHSFSPEIQYSNYQTININELVGKDVHDGLLEVTVFPIPETGLKQEYYNEAWASVVSQDKRTEVNYPMLITRGACPGMIDASYLYYPGVHATDSLMMNLVIMNHHDFETEYDVMLHDAAGLSVLKCSGTIAPKTLKRIALDELFPDVTTFLKSGPGMLLFHYDYKLNAYLQTLNTRTGCLYGMDHLGLMFASMDEDAALGAKDRGKDDKLVCYCKNVSTKQLLDLKKEGCTLSKAMKDKGVGTVCLGCTQDLESLFGEKCERLKKKSYKHSNDRSQDFEVPEDPRIDPKLHKAYWDDIIVKYANKDRSKIDSSASTYLTGPIDLKVNHFEQHSTYKYMMYDESQPAMVDYNECIVCGTDMIPASCLTNKKGEDFLTLGICPHCGFFQHTKRPPPEWYQNFYRNVWDPEAREAWPTEPGINKTVMERLTPIIAPQSKILEIGSGWGKSILAFHLTGHKTFATEATAHRSEFIRTKLGIPCFTGESENTPLDTPGYEAGTFDGIISTNVLEHVYNTRTLLEHIIKFLKPGGWAYLEVPTYYQENLTLNTHGMAHTCNFTQENFSYLVESLGMEVVKDFSTPNYVSVFAIKNPGIAKVASRHLNKPSIPHQGLAYILEKNGLSRLPASHTHDIGMKLSWYLGEEDIARRFFYFEMDIKRNDLPLIEELKKIIRMRKPLELAAPLLPVRYVYDSDNVPIWFY